MKTFLDELNELKNERMHFSSTQHTELHSIKMEFIVENVVKVDFKY